MSTEKKEKKKNVHAGHRKRMKKEFVARGLKGWPEHRVLELLLFYGIPQKDVNELAHDLVDKFGSVYGVFHATYDQLVSVNGIGENAATLICLIPALFGFYLQESTDLNIIYQSSRELKELLRPMFFGARNEKVILACFDAKMMFLNYYDLGEGSVDSASFDTRKIMETALACNASRVVLAHNHVSGIAMPSTADIATTQRLARSLQQVEITLYDHCILVDDDMVSMRDSGYLKDFA